MPKRGIIVVSALCLSIAVLCARSLSQPGEPKRLKPIDFERLRNMSEEEKQEEIEKWRAESKLERERRKKEFRERAAEHRQRSELAAKERREKWEEEKQEAAGFIIEKYALGAAEEQWELIKTKLEKVKQLRREARMPSIKVWGIERLPGGKGPEYLHPQYLHEWTWQWHRPSKEKRYAELTEDERAIEDVISAIVSRNTVPATFERVTQALRDSRGKLEAQKRQKQRELSEAREELRKILTTRQEAVLVLMGWL